MSRLPGKPKSLLARFMSHVIKTDGCWEWTGCKSGGYGRIWVKTEIGWQKSWSHRVSYQMFCGEIPDHLFVCHSCDNPGCVNPLHLWLGTMSDNVKDMHKKGRGKFNFNVKKGIRGFIKSGSTPSKSGGN